MHVGTTLVLFGIGLLVAYFFYTLLEKLLWKHPLLSISFILIIAGVVITLISLFLENRGKKKDRHGWVID